VRNKIKRRLRHAFQHVDLSQESLSQLDFIVIVKDAAILQSPFQELLACLKLITHKDPSN